MSRPHSPPFHKDIHFYLRVIRLLENSSAKEVGVRLHMSPAALSYHLQKLLVLDVIEYAGFGVWHVKNENVPSLYLQKNTTNDIVKMRDPIRSRNRVGGLQKNILTSGRQRPNIIRTHALQFTVKIPRLQNWTMNYRRKYFVLKNIKFEKRDFQCGECVFIDGCRLWLTNKSIVVWLAYEWFVKDPHTGFRYGVYELHRIILKVESLLNVSLRIHGRHWFKTSRQHHALIKNGLAEQYNKEKRKLFVFDEKGLWLLIDDSDGLNELEYVATRDKSERSGASRETEDTKRAREVQEFFNHLPETLQLIQGSAAGVHELKQEFREVKDTLQMVVDIQKLQVTSSVIVQKSIVLRKEDDA